MTYRVVSNPQNFVREANKLKVRREYLKEAIDCIGAQRCASGKLFADYKRKKSTQEYLEALSSNMRFPIVDLINLNYIIYC